VDLERTSELLNRREKDMLKEINVIEALNRFLKDDDVKCLVPMGTVDEWGEYQAMMLSEVLSGIVFMADGAPVHVREETVKPKEAEIVFTDEPPIETDDTEPDPKQTEETEPEAEEETESEETTRRGPKGKAYFDEGKARALFEAGWKVPAIAEEMGFSQATVYNHLKKMGVDMTR